MDQKSSASQRPESTGPANAGTPFIQIEGVSKYFGDFCAVDNVDLTINKGELFSILGGSGCGKTTLLRMLAGFEVPTSGRIIIDGQDMTKLPPYARPVNMMFQSYALFPHMNVWNNVAYGLKRENMSKGALTKRVDDILKLVQLSELHHRKPHQLSGGQQQRVALARALVKRPKVLLLDEPLAALDKKLREQTQFELANIQDDLGVTFVVVTHDQEEAMTLSTQVAVMNEGRFEQIGTPRDVYENPSNRFVADFIGTINLFEGKVITNSGSALQIESADLGIGVVVPHTSDIENGSPVTVALRPEKVFVTKDRPSGPNQVGLKGIIHDQGYFGKLSIFRVEIETGKIVQVSAQNRVRSSKRTWDWDEEVYLSWDQASLLVLVE